MTRIPRLLGTEELYIVRLVGLPQTTLLLLTLIIVCGGGIECSPHV